MKEALNLLSRGDVPATVQRLNALMEAHPDQLKRICATVCDQLILQYDALDLKPVHDFIRVYEDALPPEAAPDIKRLVAAKVERTRHYYRELRAVRHERMLREARGDITYKEAERATTRGLALIDEGKTTQEKKQLLRQFVRAIGDMTRDRDAALKVVRALSSSPSVTGLDVDLIMEFQTASESAQRGGFKETDRAWTQFATQATVALTEMLPFRNQVGAPSDEELDLFVGELLAVFRAGVVSGRPDDIIESLVLFKEFSPTDPAAYESVAGAEPQMFTQLGPKAKLTSVRALQKIGESDSVRNKILEYSQTPSGRSRVRLMAPVMGGLARIEFDPYLFAALASVKDPKASESVIEALGRIGSPDGIDKIIEKLQEVMKNRRFDTALIRKAQMILTSLGRIARSKRIDADRRARLVRQVIQAVGEQEALISSFAADQMFSLRLGELDHSSRAWGVRQLLFSLFQRDRGMNAKEAQSSPLGFRKPLAAALIRLGKDMLPEMVEGAATYASNYSGGFQAFAEVMEKAGDGRAVSLLETMTRAAFLFDDARAGGLLEEKVMDAASGEMKGLSRDAVIHSLIFAIKECGGPQGEAALLHIADQVQTGQFNSPGIETDSFLGRIKLDAGQAGKLSHQAVAPAEQVPQAEVDEALSNAKGGLMSKVPKRVAALAVLGRAKSLDAIPTIIQCLGDKKTLISGAAETALSQYLLVAPTPEQYEEFLVAVLRGRKHIKGDAIERLNVAIGKYFPRRAPYDKIFRRTVETTLGDSQTAFFLIKAFEMAGDLPGEGVPKQGDESEEDDLKGHPTKRLALLDQKREYLKQRRAWVQSGKKGPAPEAPPE